MFCNFIARSGGEELEWSKQKVIDWLIYAELQSKHDLVSMLRINFGSKLMILHKNELNNGFITRQQLTQRAN